MNPNIFKNGIKIINFEKNGRCNVAHLENGTQLLSGLLEKIECECSQCGIRKEIKFRTGILGKSYFCQSCNKKGEKNPFYGKSHNDEFKKSHSKLMKGRYIGEKNPFYGKSHNIETRNILKEKCKKFGKENGFYGKSHSDEYKKIASLRSKQYESGLTDEERFLRSKKISNKQQQLKLSDPFYFEKKSKAGRISANSPAKYKMNKLEKTVYKKALEMGINFQYSVILNFMQFDFGIKEHKILLEVNGDYWHANPNYYGNKSNLKPINNTQLKKIESDTEKQKFVSSKNIKLFVIWEEQIKNNDWSVLEEIKNEIQID